MTPELIQTSPKLSTLDREWLKIIPRIADGDEAALSEFYDGTIGLVYSLAIRILSDKSEAEDVTIEVYMQVWDKASDYDPDKSSPSAWLMMLTRSRAIDRLRNRSKMNLVEGYEEGDHSNPNSGPEEITVAAEQRKIVQNALGKLAPQQRRAIELAYFYGLSQSEIAREMDQPLGTIKSWIRFGMIKLRDSLSIIDE